MLKDLESALPPRFHSRELSLALGFSPKSTRRSIFTLRSTRRSVYSTECSRLSSSSSLHPDFLPKLRSAKLHTDQTEQVFLPLAYHEDREEGSFEQLSGLYRGLEYHLLVLAPLFFLVLPLRGLRSLVTFSRPIAKSNALKDGLGEIKITERRTAPSSAIVWGVKVGGSDNNGG